MGKTMHIMNISYRFILFPQFNNKESNFNNFQYLRSFQKGIRLATNMRQNCMPLA